MLAIKRSSPPSQFANAIRETPRKQQAIIVECQQCGESFLLLYSPHRVTEADARQIFAERVWRDHQHNPPRHPDGFSLEEPPTRAEITGLLARRIDFWIENLRSYLAFGESRIQIEYKKDEEEARDVRQAVINVYGDDAPTDMDVEFLQERWGCDDPDAPFRPYSSMRYMFPRYLRYSFIALAALVFESELRVLCGAIAADRGVPSFDRKLGGGAMFKEAKKFLTQHVGKSCLESSACAVLDDMFKVRNCIVHANGRINFSKDKDKEHLEMLTKRNNGLSINCVERPELRLLDVEKGYCESIVDHISSFFTGVFEAVGYSGPGPI
jgi:hypothetical protein